LLTCKITDFEYDLVPIVSLINNNIVDQRIVLKHIRKCSKGCTPDDVLNTYLNNPYGQIIFPTYEHLSPIHINVLARKLCRIAEEYESIGASSILVKRFFIRSADIDLIQGRKDLDSNELYEAINIFVNYWIKNTLIANSYNFKPRIDVKSEKLDYILDLISRLELENFRFSDDFKFYVGNMVLQRIMDI